MSKSRAITTLTALMMTTGLVAAERTYEVPSFTGISLGTGIEAEIICGDGDTVTLMTSEKLLDRMIVETRHSELLIKRKTSDMLFGDFSNNDGEVKARIVTRGQINQIDNSTGASLSVDACAVDSSRLEVEISTGAMLEVAGMTMELDLDMSTGSMFNRKTEGFRVDRVKLDMSTGATANLCGAAIIRGDASTGAEIYANDNADKRDLDLNLGADVSSRKCR